MLQIANSYQQHRLVSISSPNYLFNDAFLSTTIPNDSYFNHQWHLDNIGQNPPDGDVDADIDAPEAWNLETGSSEIIVAVIDTGVDIDHPDLDDNMWININESLGDANVDGRPGVMGFDDDGDGLTDEDSMGRQPGEFGYSNDLVNDDDENGYNDDIFGYDFAGSDGSDPDSDPDDVFGHGTGCAGLVAAESNNNVGVAGVCWNCKTMAVKLGTDDGAWVSVEVAAESICYAVDNGASVLSNSWSSPGTDPILVDCIKYARNSGRNGKGCVIVFASGNYGYLFTSPNFPALLDQVISVGSTTENDTIWTYSQWGSQLDVVAPSNTTGCGQTSTLVTTDVVGSGGCNSGSYPDFLDDGYTRFFGGTSGACPQVAGLAALILSQNPELRAAEVQSLIQAGAQDQVGPTPVSTPTSGEDVEGWDAYYGWGRINAHTALAMETALPGPTRGLSRFVLGNGSPTPTPLAAFDQFGFLYLTGNLKGTHVPTRYNVQNQTPIPTPDPTKDEFYLQNGDGTPVALFDAENGDLFIAGEVHTHRTVPTPHPSNGEFRVRNPEGTPVALITEEGDLYLRGDYFNESSP